MDDQFQTEEPDLNVVRGSAALVTILGALITFCIITSIALLWLSKFWQ